MTPLCLIIPPSPFLLDERVFMSLGVLRVAASLERHGVPVELLDLSGIENFTEALRVHARVSQARVFGITSTTPQMPSAALLAGILRRERPDSRLILGGPHPTLTHAAMKKEKTPGRATKAMRDLTRTFDIVICGDGEKAILDVLDPHKDSLWRNQIVDADDPKSMLFLTNEDLNDLAFPARHLIDFESYHYSIDGVPATSLIAQLGCPFGCGFCGGRNSPMLRRVRTRTTENVIHELSHLYKTYGVRGFMFYDDELNVNTQLIPLMNEISKLQKDLGVEFRLRGFVKSQLFTDAQAEAMYKAGFRWLLTGFESGSQRILTNINKRATRDENTRCAQIAKRHGLKVKALMSIGHPGESRQTLRETKEWLLETRPEDFDVTIITPYPGSPYYDEAKLVADQWVYTYPETGDKLYAEEVDYFKTADYYKGDPNGGYRSYVSTDDLSKDDLVRGRDELEADVRAALKIPYNPSTPARRFEHSMGQTELPSTIFRKTKTQGGIPVC